MSAPYFKDVYSVTINGDQYYGAYLTFAENETADGWVDISFIRISDNCYRGNRCDNDYKEYWKQLGQMNFSCPYDKVLLRKLSDKEIKKEKMIRYSESSIKQIDKDNQKCIDAYFDVYYREGSVRRNIPSVTTSGVALQEVNEEIPGEVEVPKEFNNWFSKVLNWRNR